MKYNKQYLVIIFLSLFCISSYGVKLVCNATLFNQTEQSAEEIDRAIEDLVSLYLGELYGSNDLTTNTVLKISDDVEEQLQLLELSTNADVRTLFKDLVDSRLNTRVEQGAETLAEVRDKLDEQNESMDFYSNLCNRHPQIQDAVISFLNENDEEIDSCEDVTAEHLLMIDELDLTYRGIDGFNHYDFYGMDNLEWLYLNNNGFERLPAHIFDGLPRLKYINLSNNNLTELDVNIFTHNNDLTTIYIQENEISKFLPETIAHLRNMEFFHIEGNDLVSEDIDPLEDLLEKTSPNVQFVY